MSKGKKVQIQKDKKKSRQGGSSRPTRKGSRTTGPQKGFDVTSKRSRPRTRDEKDPIRFSGEEGRCETIGAGNYRKQEGAFGSSEGPVS